MQLTYISFRTVIVETVSTKHGFVEVRSPIMSKPLIGAAGEEAAPASAIKVGKVALAREYTYIIHLIGEQRAMAF